MMTIVVTFCSVALSKTRIEIQLMESRCMTKFVHDTVFSTRCNIYISRLCYDVSVRLSVTEVHCGHGACREEGRGHLALC